MPAVALTAGVPTPPSSTSIFSLGFTVERVSPVDGVWTIPDIVRALDALHCTFLPLPSRVAHPLTHSTVLLLLFIHLLCTPTRACRLRITNPLSPSHTHPHTPTLTHLHAHPQHSYSHSHAYSHSYLVSLSYTHTRALALLLSHSHTHANTHTYAHTAGEGRACACGGASPLNTVCGLRRHRAGGAGKPPNGLRETAAGC